MSAHQHHVLIIEDDQDCREAIGAVLRSAGYRVTYAPDGQVAIDELRRVNPCVILLDLMMPVRDGWWFRAQQLRDEELMAIPTIAMSATGNIIESAQQLGLQDYIKKPVDPELLVTILERHFE